MVKNVYAEERLIRKKPLYL